MRKKLTFRILSLAALSAVAMCCSLSLVSCASDEKGTPPSTSKAEPLRFSLTLDGYEDTRGYVSNDMDESVGLFAYIFDNSLLGDFDNISVVSPSYMFDEEMQFNGTNWQTVGTFEQPETGKLMRFYAYYPFGLPESILEFDFNQDVDNENMPIGAPTLIYKVSQDIEEQIDLMAGKSINDISSNDIRTAGALTIGMSHLLTAVEFQIGKCSDNGRVVKIELKNVLGVNTYSLAQHLETVEDPSNPPNTMDVIVIDGWGTKSYESNKSDFKDFSAKLNTRLTKTTTENPTPQKVMDDENAFLMIPQQLPDKATLEVTINSGGSDHVLSASMAGKRWLQGKRVIYTLDVENLTKLSVKSQITPWDDSHENIDGVATDGVTILMNTNITDWADSIFTMSSDDPRTTP
jgi:hypothetical protein